MEPRAGGLSADGAQANAPAPDAPAYDLATAVADYPPWEGRPRSTLVLAAHPRSGSTLLGEAIHAAGGAGLPLEYFHRGFRPRFAARWRTRSLDAYIGAAHRFRTDPTGVFAVKLFWQDVEDLAVERGAAPPANPTPDGYRTLFAQDRGRHSQSELHPPAAWRTGINAKAVSVLVAQQTGHWRDVPAPWRRPATGWLRLRAPGRPDRRGGPLPPPLGQPLRRPWRRPNRAELRTATRRLSGHGGGPIVADRRAGHQRPDAAAAPTIGPRVGGVGAALSARGRCAPSDRPAR